MDLVVPTFGPLKVVALTKGTTFLFQVAPDVPLQEFSSVAPDQGGETVVFLLASKVKLVTVAVAVPVRVVPVRTE